VLLLLCLLLLLLLLLCSPKKPAARWNGSRAAQRSAALHPNGSVERTSMTERKR
jgi:hypothetical protein